MHATMQQLREALPLLSANDRRFASDLLAAFGRYGSLTPGQSPWPQKLIDKANGTQQPRATVNVGDMAAVIQLFTTARQSLKWPKVRLLCSGSPLILSLAGERSSAPGTVQISGEGTYPNRAWYGRITASGQWEPARNVSAETLTDIAALLSEFGRDPSAMAAAYGRATNHCCFCQRELTDARSVAAGYGPICAEHYGLSAAWATAAGTTPAATTTEPAMAFQSDLWGSL